MLFLHELEQVLVLVKQFTPASSIETFLLLQPLRWCCVDCVFHHERDVREE